MAGKKQKGPTIGMRLVEGIPHSEDERQEVKILSEFVGSFQRYSVDPHYLRKSASPKTFLTSLVGGRQRYVHVSVHGSADGDGLCAPNGKLVDASVVHKFCRGRGSPPLQRRFLTASACGRPSSRFWADFHGSTGVVAVVAPLGTVGFDDAAMFYTAFYYSLIRLPRSREGQNDEVRLLDFIDTFQRAKTSFLGLGGSGAFRLLYWWGDGGELKEVF